MTAAVAAVLASGSTAAPSSTAATPLLDQVNAVRRQLGLTPLASDPVALHVVTRMAKGDRTDRAPEVLEAQPDCAVCDMFFEGGGATDPRDVSTARSAVARAIRFGLWRAGWSATDNLSVFFPAAALVLDPRARTFALARTPLGMLVVGVTADADARFDRAGSLALRTDGPAAPALGRGRAAAGLRLSEPLRRSRRPGRDRGLSARGGEGLPRLTPRRLRPQHVARVRPRVPRRHTPAGRAAQDEGHARRVRCAAAGRSTSVTGTERDAFLDAVRRTPAQLRALLAELDGAVDVVGGSEACLSADACEDVDGERASVGMAVSASREVIVHELGHVVFDLALDERGRRAFRSAFIRTGWDNAQFIPVSEQFADQVEHWALGDASSDPRWLSARRARKPAPRARRVPTASPQWDC